MSQEYLVLYYGTIGFYVTEQSFVFTEQLFFGPQVASSDSGAANLVVCKHTLVIAVKLTAIDRSQPDSTNLE